jgi:hypothetical protein
MRSLALVTHWRGRGKTSPSYPGRTPKLPPASTTRPESPAERSGRADALRASADAVNCRKAARQTIRVRTALHMTLVDAIDLPDLATEDTHRCITAAQAALAHAARLKRRQSDCRGASAHGPHVLGAGRDGACNGSVGEVENRARSSDHCRLAAPPAGCGFLTESLLPSTDWCAAWADSNVSSRPSRPAAVMRLYVIVAPHCRFSAGGGSARCLLFDPSTTRRTGERLVVHDAAD